VFLQWFFFRLLSPTNAPRVLLCLPRGAGSRIPDEPQDAVLLVSRQQFCILMNSHSCRCSGQLEQPRERLYTFYPRIETCQTWQFKRNFLQNSSALSHEVTNNRKNIFKLYVHEMVHIWHLLKLLLYDMIWWYNMIYDLIWYDMIWYICLRNQQGNEEQVKSGVAADSNEEASGHLALSRFLSPISEPFLKMKLPPLQRGYKSQRRWNTIRPTTCLSSNLLKVTFVDKQNVHAYY
jgi:hypothetical protein